VLCSLVAGLVFSMVLGPPVVLTFVLSFSVSAITLYLFLRRSPFSVFGVILAFALAGSLYHTVAERYIKRDDVSFTLDRYRPVWMTVRGTVANDPEQREGRTVFDLVVESTEDKKTGSVKETTGRVRVTIYDNLPLIYGDRLLLTGNLARPKPPTYKGGFDYGAYLKARGISTTLTVPSGKFVTVEGRGTVNPVYSFSYAVRRYSAAALDRYVGGEEGRLIKGMMLGTRGEIGTDVVSEFTDAGVVHILAISGQNVSLVAFVLFLLLSGTGLPRKACALIVAAFLPIYTIMTGLDPPVVRATVMGLLVVGATFMDRDVDLINVLSASAVFLLVLNPLLISDASFQLSYAATFAIALFYKPISARMGFLPSLIKETAAATFAAQIGVLPLQLYLFYRVSPVALVSNLVVVPASTLASVFGLLTIVGAVVHPFLGELYGAATWLVIKVIMLIVRASAHGFEPLGRAWPAVLSWRPFVEYGDLQFWVGRPAVPVIMALCAVILFFAVRTRFWRITLSILCAAFLGFTLFGKLAKGLEPPVRVTFIDVGNGESALLETPDAKRVLINAGYGNEDYSAGRARVGPFLRSRGINRIDILCLTSAEAGAVGGASYILDNFNVGELWAVGETGIGGYYAPVPKVAENGAGVLRLDPASRDIAFGDAKLRIIESEDSYVLTLIYGRFKLVYPGFSDPETARRAAGSGVVANATVLKVPGRGAIESHADEFAYVANPVFAVISTKRGGKTEKPAPVVVEGYENLETDVIVTADRGSVIVESDGETLHISTAF
jgi:competence protein ComEC